MLQSRPISEYHLTHTALWDAWTSKQAHKRHREDNVKLYGTGTIELKCLGTERNHSVTAPHLYKFQNKKYVFRRLLSVFVIKHSSPKIYVFTSTNEFVSALLSMVFFSFIYFISFFWSKVDLNFLIVIVTWLLSKIKMRTNYMPLTSMPLLIFDTKIRNGTNNKSNSGNQGDVAA